MEQNNSSIHSNKLVKLGLILGPLFIVLGIILLNIKKEGSKTIPYIIIFIGIVRLLSSIILMMKSRKMNQ
jgi:hypothetical protein